MWKKSHTNSLLNLDNEIATMAALEIERLREVIEALTNENETLKHEILILKEKISSMSADAHMIQFKLSNNC